MPTLVAGDERRRCRLSFRRPRQKPASRRYGAGTPFGGQGDDSLSGDFDANILTGGSGVDTFALNERSADAMDTITKFEDSETIELKDFIYPASCTTTVDGDLIITVDGMNIALVKDAASFFDLSDIAYD